MVEHGLDINKENILGITPIFNACGSGNLNLVKYLVELGVDLHKEAKYFGTPLFNACKMEI